MVVALAYKHLWMVEAIFRSMKSLLETRPIYHQGDDAIRGHVFCSFLALVLRQELQRRLAAKQWSLEWADVVRDLNALHETEITLDNQAYVVRSETKRTVGKVFQACGVASRPPCAPPTPPRRRTAPPSPPPATEPETRRGVSLQNSCRCK